MPYDHAVFTGLSVARSRTNVLASPGPQPPDFPDEALSISFN